MNTLNILFKELKLARHVSELMHGYTWKEILFYTLNIKPTEQIDLWNVWKAC